MKDYKLKILHVVSLDPSHGGPTEVVQQLHLAKNKNYISKVIDIRKLVPSIFLFKKRYVRFINKFDIIHIHSFFQMGTSKISKIAQKLSIPVVYTLHGNFNVWSLNQNSLVKKIYLYFFSGLLKKSTIHFLNLQEREEYKILNSYKKNFIFPNSLDVKKILKKTNFKKLPFQDRSLKILFLGRLHEKKGLEIALHSLRKLIDEKFEDIEFNIYGPSSDYFKKKLNILIDNLELKNFVKIYPAQFGDNKFKVLSNHDIFLLPSLDEADSVAIKESLLSETPVIISNECKFDQVNNVCGIVCKTSAEEVSEAIKFFINNPKKIVEMGKNGKEMIINNFDIDKNIYYLNDIYKSLFLRLNRTYDYDGYNFYE